MRSNSHMGFGNMVEFGMVMVEAQAVIGMRLMGMLGLWNVTGGEDRRMVSEKAEALVEAAHGVTTAMLRGATPDQITAAAIRPIRQRTRANVRRLSKRSISKG